MDKQNAVFDASFWINAHHAKVLAYLPDYFHLIVPKTVVEEIEYSPPDVNQRTPAGEEFFQWRQADRFEIQDPTQPVNWFDPGENAAIALAQEEGYLLLIDDQAPYHLAKSRGLKTVASTDFVILLYTDRYFSYEDAITRLAESGIARHLKRAGMTALSVLARQRRERHDDSAI